MYKYANKVYSDANTMIEIETKQVTLSDGRTLAYAEFGDQNGIPVFYAHGGPGSRLDGVIFHETARRYGFRLIATDRPGMGRSTFKPDRRLLDYPKDIVELADSMSVDKFGVLGWSGGGAHTVVCGYEIADRLLFNIALAGYTNFAELPAAAGMLRSRMDQMSVGLSRRSPRLFRFFFDLMGWGVNYFPNAFMSELRKSVSEKDREIMSVRAFRDMFISTQREAFAQGSRGVTVDAAVHYVDWGFRLREITTKTHVFHGIEDQLVPVAFGKHLAENIPNCELHLLEGEGHLFPVKYQELIFETAQAELRS